MSRAIIVYGTLDRGESARSRAEERARELAQVLRLPRLPKLVSSRSPEMVHGMLRPVVLDVIGFVSTEMRETLAVCDPVFIDDRLRGVAQP